MSTSPSRRLTRAAVARRRAEEQLEQATAELHAAIAEDLAAGVRPTDVVSASGYTREQVRRIRKAAGLPPAR